MDEVSVRRKMSTEVPVHVADSESHTLASRARFHPEVFLPVIWQESSSEQNSASRYTFWRMLRKAFQKKKCEKNFLFQPNPGFAADILQLKKQKDSKSSTELFGVLVDGDLVSRLNIHHNKNSSNNRIKNQNLVLVNLQQHETRGSVYPAQDDFFLTLTLERSDSLTRTTFAECLVGFCSYFVRKAAVKLCHMQALDRLPFKNQTYQSGHHRWHCCFSSPHLLPRVHNHAQHHKWFAFPSGFWSPDFHLPN